MENNLGRQVSSQTLKETFGKILLENVRMADFSTARLGGPVKYLIIIKNKEELENTIINLWKLDLPYYLIGGGSNILFAETGLPEMIVINQARKIEVVSDEDKTVITAESGALLSKVSQTAANYNLSGLEWAVNLPGSVGGAVYGNAGAFGGETGKNLVLAEILQGIEGKEVWQNEDFEYAYRSSVLKRNAQKTVILSATLQVIPGDPQEIQALMEKNRSKRRRKQPPGACTGSMFKNPPGDFAGRLIEACGLKGTKIGDAQISDLHANFFINLGSAAPEDFLQLIQLARQSVLDEFGINLELEVELIGDW